MYITYCVVQGMEDTLREKWNHHFSTSLNTTSETMDPYVIERIKLLQREISLGGLLILDEGDPWRVVTNPEAMGPGCATYPTPYAYIGQDAFGGPVPPS